jgi:hypothetical protein
LRTNQIDNQKKSINKVRNVKNAKNAWEFYLGMRFFFQNFVFFLEFFTFLAMLLLFFIVSLIYSKSYLKFSYFYIWLNLKREYKSAVTERENCQKRERNPRNWIFIVKTGSMSTTIYTYKYKYTQNYLQNSSKSDSTTEKITRNANKCLFTHFTLMIPPWKVSQQMNLHFILPFEFLLTHITYVYPRMFHQMKFQPFQRI